MVKVAAAKERVYTPSPKFRKLFRFTIIEPSVLFDTAKKPSLKLFDVEPDLINCPERESKSIKLCTPPVGSCTPDHCDGS